MWQDILVSLVAIGAVAILGRRWFGKKAAATPSCDHCPQGESKNS